MGIQPHTHGGSGWPGRIKQRGSFQARRLLSISTSLIAFVGFFSGQAAAQSAQNACGDVPSQFQAIADLLTRIQQLGVALGLLIAALMYVWAGILWMRGTPDSQQRARRIFMNTSIGLVLILIAGGLVEFIKTVLCGGG